MNDVRSQFPFFSCNPELIYLDSAATTQKPQQVLEAMERHLRSEAANPGRGSYRLATRASRVIEEVRDKVSDFIGADSHSVGFTSGATAALNSITQCWARHNLQAGEEVMLSSSDHIANVGPWYRLAQEMDLRIIEYRLTPSGDPDISDIEEKISGATKVLVLTHVHNIFGERTNVTEIRQRVGEQIFISLDAAQSAGHLEINSRTLGADFISFSAHKMFGPPGVGVLWASNRAISSMQPLTVGGGIRESSGLAAILEAGTLNTSGIVGLGQAIDFIGSIGLSNIFSHTSDLTRKLLSRLQAMEHVDLLPGIVASPGCPFGYGIVSFRVNKISAADVGFVLDDQGICVRTGDHCAKDNSLAGNSVRISVHAYNTETEIERVCDALSAIRA